MNVNILNFLCQIELFCSNAIGNFVSVCIVVLQKNSARLRSRWFQQTTMQEFRESLIAHAAVRRPDMLFREHCGSKVRSTDCRQVIRLSQRLNVFTRNYNDASIARTCSFCRTCISYTVLVTMLNICGTA